MNEEWREEFLAGLAEQGFFVFDLDSVGMDTSSVLPELVGSEWLASEVAASNPIVLDSAPAEFAPSPLVERLGAYAQAAFQENQFRPAQVGKGAERQTHAAVRRDQIFWIEDWAEPPLAEYGNFLTELSEIFRREFFLPIKSFEGHFALYQEGDFYVRHVDRHRNEPHRLISMVLYLNTAEGGELVIYGGGGGGEEGEDAAATVIAPKAGRVVVFKSELPHEVKPAGSARLSLTCWFRDDLGR